MAFALHRTNDPENPKLGSVSICPSHDVEQSGTFRIWLIREEASISIGPDEAREQSVLLWDKEKEGRFPEVKELVSHLLASSSDSRALTFFLCYSPSTLESRCSSGSPSCID